MSGLTLPDEGNQSEKYPFAKTDKQYVLVRKPDAKGAVVAKFSKSPEGNNRFPKALFDSDALICTFPDESAFNSASVDQTDLTDYEAEIVEQAGYPTDVQ